jgi:hypothetical protein
VSIQVSTQMWCERDDLSKTLVQHGGETAERLTLILIFSTTTLVHSVWPQPMMRVPECYGCVWPWNKAGQPRG